jgi:hypothetical protein
MAVLENLDRQVVVCSFGMRKWRVERLDAREWQQQPVSQGWLDPLISKNIIAGVKRERTEFNSSMAVARGQF